MRIYYCQIARLLVAAALISTTISFSPVRADDFNDCAIVPAEAAIPYCTRGIESGRYTGAELAGLYLNRGLRYDYLKDRERALSDYNAALKVDPAHVKAYNNRGGLYHTQFKDNERALADYDQALKIDPNYPNSYLGRGGVFRAIGNYERALEDYSKAIKLNPSWALAYYNRGLTYLQLKELDKALVDENAAIKFAPKAWPPLWGRGAVNFANGKFDLAIADYNAAIQINAKVAMPLYARGLAKLKKGDTAGGNNDIAAAIAIEAAVADDWLTLTKILPDGAKAETDQPKIPPVAVAPLPPEGPQSVPHVEPCTNDSWGFLAFHGFEFGTVNSCQEAVSIWFMRRNGEIKNETVKGRGVFRTGYDVDTYKDKIIPWMSATCPAGYEPSPPFSSRNQKAFDDSTYKCVAVR